MKKLLCLILAVVVAFLFGWVVFLMSSFVLPWIVGALNGWIGWIILFVSSVVAPAILLLPSSAIIGVMGGLLSNTWTYGRLLPFFCASWFVGRYAVYEPLFGSIVKVDVLDWVITIVWAIMFIWVIGSFFVKLMRNENRADQKRTTLVQ